MKCNYCGNETQFMSSKEFYGTDYGVNLYVCRPCDAYVGTHGKGRTPLGTLANSRLRGIRRTAHSMFDPLWKGKHRKMSRGKAYQLMQQLMNLPPQKAHIGMFNEEQCWLLIEHVKEYRGLK